MSKKRDFYDDGRTIADMNIEGMPFYDDKLQHQKRREPDERQKPELSKKEIRQVAFSGMLAGLMIASIFVILAAIFIAIICIFG